MKLILITLALSSFPAAAGDCSDDFDPRGAIVGYEYPDGDPVYENLGKLVGFTPGLEPIFDKTGATYGHRKGEGNITGFTPDGDPLYDGEKHPKFSIDGDRLTPLGEKRKKFDLW